MKHFNINKLLGAAIIILLFAGCDNSLSNIESAESAKNTGLSVSGTISVGGAAPARSATSSFTDSLSWVIRAVTSNNDQAQATTSQRSFTLNFPVSGVYEVAAVGYADSQPVFAGTLSDVQVTQNGLASELVIPVSPLPFNSQSNSYGSAALSFTDQTGRIKKVRATFTKYQASSVPPVKVAANFNSGSAILSAESLTAGSYITTFTFEDVSGNNLYVCKEAVTIYPGMTTDTWYGNAPYLTAENRFVLTSAIINNYPSELVPNSDILLYNYVTQPNAQSPTRPYLKYNYYLSSEASLANVPSDVAVTSELTDGNDSIKDATCFDAEGNLYLLQMLDNSSICLESTKTGWTAPNRNDTNNGLGIAFSYERNIKLAVDSKTNNMCIFVIDQDADTSISVYKYPQLISSNGTNCTNTHQSVSFEGSLLYNYHFAINNNNLYMISRASYNATSYTLRIYDLSGSGTSISPIKSSTLNLTTILPDAKLDSDDCNITDMIYQDGSLYMLYKEVTNYNFSDAVYSRGAVIKYNLLTGVTNTTGFTPTKIEKDRGFKMQGFGSASGSTLPLFTTEELTEPYVPDGVETTTSPIVNKYPDIYRPADNEKAFYGPTKFIAVKPKKLVISDEGYTFYTDDDDLLYFKNINRVVYVDLEDFAVSEIKTINSGLSLDEDNTSGNLIGTGNQVYYDVDAYRSDGTHFAADSCYLGVINGDVE